ncbi:MAG: 4-hydroxythreonine-4-phosphate dehydrogenase PdxA [Burkholderiales bacterium]|nr:4-hydroxythreonine-4-phosphate dehydrogenase PdxA [Burkholderiales bacterium]
MSIRPTIAVFTGDPAGIGPELTAKLLADPATQAKADVLLISHRAGLDDAANGFGAAPAPRLHDWAGLAAPACARAAVSETNGRFMLDALAEGARLVVTGKADAFCFAPLNKGALRAGGMVEEDEMRWFAELLRHDGPCGELNVLEDLWTSRVTSHIPLREVSAHLSAEKVAEAIGMITRALRAAGKAAPRVAVCGLNPHNGDNGNYGDEEGRIIEPGVRLAASRGFPADGPFSADTAFVRAIRKDGSGYDGVVTMYHDQGQIAMKLMGFERGVTVQGGLPIPITTPAHGTAYDIAGRGIANPQAMKNAFDIACRMGMSRRAAAPR